MTSSVTSSVIRISEPQIFHREYENDLGKNDPDNKSALSQCQRVGLVALPFLSLYQPFSYPLAFGLGAIRCVISTNQLIDAISTGDQVEIGNAMIQTAIAVAALACTIFAHPLGLLITTGQDLLINCTQLFQAIQEQNSQKALEASLHILNNVLYLGLFLSGGQVELMIAVLSMQIVLGLYQSSAEFQKGNYLEGFGHMAMVAVRVNQLHPQIKALQIKRQVQATNEKASVTQTAPTEEVVLNKASKTAVVNAIRVESGIVNGCHIHVGYYRDNITVMTIIEDPRGSLKAGSQYIWADDALIGYSDAWLIEFIAGIQYVKHWYEGGVCVYSTSTSQYIVY